MRCFTFLVLYKLKLFQISLISRKFNKKKKIKEETDFKQIYKSYTAFSKNIELAYLSDVRLVFFRFFYSIFFKPWMN